jgi:HK97 family phage portal protein
MIDAAVHQKEWARLRQRPRSVEVLPALPKAAEVLAPAQQSERSSIEMTTTQFAAWLDEHDEYGASESGVAVSNESAMRQVAVMACIRLLAESLASIPLVVYRRTSSGGKDRADDHDVYPVLHDQWNEYQTSFVGRETQQAQAVGRGNTYAVIERDGGGYLSGLWPVPPGTIEPAVDNGKLWYRITDTGVQWMGIKPGVYAPDKILHIPGLGFDGIRGYNPIQLAKQAIGLGAAAELHGARFYGAGGRPGGVLMTEQKLDKDVAKDIKASWREVHEGVYKSHKTALLTHGLKYEAFTINHEEAQFLDTRKFQLTEIARLFRVPPAMIGASTGDSQTYANHEQRMLEFVMMSLRPWCVKWEQEINRKLFTPRERSRYFAEFNLDAMVRADIKARYESYRLALNNWLTRDEIRELENRNPSDGGDVFKEPTPYTPAPTAPPGATA